MANTSEIEEIRRRVDIVDVVGAYVSLKRNGPVFKGLCPFHNEKTPSFQVNPDRGLWYCFGQCSEGGDVFKFIQKIENLSFRESLERLAQRAGVILPEYKAGDRGETDKPGQRERLLKVAELATKFYQDTLKKSDDAKAYLERRALAYQVQQDFRIGFAGEDSDALWRFLKNSDVDAEDAVLAGVVVESERGFRDKLWGRVVFPIIDVQERPIAFGGRLMESVEGRPKYLNSAETPLFVKGRTLYGLWRARKSIAAADQAVIVEGYMDVVACHQAGYENVVATLGTALTDDHALMLKRYASRALLAFDADAAGMKAAQKANEIFKRHEIETRMLDMPEGEDPDSVLRDGNRAKLDIAIKNALSVSEFHLRKLIANIDLAATSEDDRLTIFRREALPILRSTRSPMERNELIRIAAPLHPHFSAGAALAEDQIREEIDGRLPQFSPNYSSNDGNWGRTGNRENSGRRFGKRWEPQRVPEPVIAPPIGIETAQQTIIRGILEGDTEVVSIVCNEVERADLIVPSYWDMIEMVRQGTPPMQALHSLEGTDPESYAAILRVVTSGDASMTTMKGETVPLDAAMIRGCIGVLRSHRLKAYKRELQARANAGDLAAQVELQNFTVRLKGSQAA